MKYSTTGLLLFLCSVFLFTLERIAAKIAASLAVIGQANGYDTTPTYPSITDNKLVLVSLILSIIFFALSFKERNT
ncbi:hypothetical protein WJ0W_003375 [Paenibacillus melissococcoides]|uniref:Uncharacterized protein n=1 Tax=Paenibacillus melissococcoides TaxID=2912268 RepID=A0ABM9G3E2_9BACL|nr:MULTISPECIES: hypothetical protein [Paenibacillus]MEB9898048.1 hypothetical protein [Bacillus cereus]CAH8246139.1 hypothetical protein WJ0W_003375 [Paenibacillus melissococcoides]CAH8713082.1 hypothetical protein WDD9_003451 [Paenibacillus melissococcoides]CAH8713816.1 hypothetical protein HTL2_003754 [Paenibacillus melissococcoides]GIO80281.1 hypothetical protein J6TS7_38910 [Paenibacillus dendritiformis]